MSPSDPKQIFTSDLSLTVDQLLANDWSGMAKSNVEAGPCHVSISQSSSYPGYFDILVAGMVGALSTHLPVASDVVGMQLDIMLKSYGYTSGDVAWSAVGPSTESASYGDVVYFAKAGDFIKIGKSSGNALARIEALQTGCPFPITVLLLLQGGYELESELHRRFSAHRSYGEWFRADPPLLEFIATSLEAQQ